MGVIDGTPVDSATTNPAFIDANADDTGLGKLTLANSDVISGSQVDNLQREHNSISSFAGKALNSVKNDLPVYTNSQGFSSTESLKSRIDNVSAKFHNISGHAHTGTSGDGPNISSSSVALVVLRGVAVEGIDLLAVTGSSKNVSAELTGKVPSNNDSTKGVVVNSPYNRVILRQASGVDSGDKFIDGLGNEVYGRITESASVWTLSFYVNISGAETAYSFSIASDVAWYFQELFNPITDAPVYSDLFFTPSENTVADIPDASETQKGKVYLSNSAASSVGSASTIGTGTRAAKDDHVHQGVHSIFKTGDTNIYGDVEFEPGANLTIVRSGNKLTFDSPPAGGVGFQEVPAGLVNGINTSFGPLTYAPSTVDSVAVFVDGINRPSSEFTISGLYVVFGSGFEPQPGQSVYVFYLYQGTPVVPPAPSGTERVEFRTISAGEESAKIIVLNYTPAAPGNVLVDIIGGGGAQEFGVDYTVVGDEFRWNGYALDGILSAGDKIRFHYLE